MDIVTEKRQIPILLSIILLALFLYLCNLWHKGLWLDEIASFEFSSLNLMTIFSSPDKPQPPLYYAILHFFLQIDKSEFFIRLPSVIFSVISIYIAHKIGKDFFDYRVGLLGAFFLATSPFFYWYAQEARMYTLFTLFSLLSLSFFYNAVRKNNIMLWIGYIASTSLDIYTHYFAFFIILIQLIFFAGFVERHRINLNRFIISLIAILLLILPQIPSFLLGTSIKTEAGISWWGVHPSLSFAPNIFYQLSSGYSVQYSWLFVLMMFVIFLYGLYSSRSEYIEEIALSTIWVFVPVVIAFLLAFKIAFDTRYIIFILPIYLVIIAKSLINIKAKRSGLFFILILIILISNTALLYENYSKPKENWKSISAYIKNNSLRNDVVLSIPSYTKPCFTYYNIDPDRVLGLNANNGDDLRPKVVRTLSTASRVWVPYTHYTASMDKDELLLNWLNQNCIEKYEFYPMQVYLCKYNSSTMDINASEIKDNII